MGNQEPGRRERLSSDATPFLKNVFPIVWTLGVGAGMVGIWLEFFGQPASIGLKILGGVFWLGTSVLFSAGSRQLHEVWVEGSNLVVRGSHRHERVPLSDVTKMTEARGQKVKTIKLHLRAGSPLGSAIRFVPRGHFQAPFSEHPVITKLKERKRLLAGESGPRSIP